MNKATVPNKRQAFTALEGIVYKACAYMHGHAPYTYGTVRNDGTVVFRFKSTGAEAAITIAERVRDRLAQRGIEFTQVDDVRLQVSLVKFVEGGHDQAQG